MRQMTDREKFLYDLQGYLVIPQVLTADEVGALNTALDAHRDQIRDDTSSATSSTLRGEQLRRLLSGMLTWEAPHCEPFRRLIADERMRPYLNTILGPGWRMDQEPFVFLAERGTEGLVFHGPGRTRPASGFMYDYNNGSMMSGMITVEFMLSDAGEGEGGFACIPGSHKANLPCPEEILLYESDPQLVVNPAVKAGDVLIFNEATIHGTLPWIKDAERRTLFYRYSPMWMQLGGGLMPTTVPDWMAELSEAERSVLEPPTIVLRAVIDDDGAVVRA